MTVFEEMARDRLERTADAVRRLVALGFEMSDQLLHGFDGRVRRHAECEREAQKRRHRCEIVEGMERELLEQMDIGGHRRVARRNQHQVPVRTSTRHGLRRDVPERPDLVLDDDRPARQRLQLACEEACNDIDAGASGEADHDADFLGGEFLRLRRHAEPGDDEQCEDVCRRPANVDAFHLRPPYDWTFCSYLRRTLHQAARRGEKSIDRHVAGRSGSDLFGWKIDMILFIHMLTVKQPLCCLCGDA